MEFFDWTILGTYAGATTAVAILTELTKNIPFIKRIPTQLWSYVLALLVMTAATLFTNGIVEGSVDWSRLVLVFINAAMVALAANGGYEAVKRFVYGPNRDTGYSD